jgi:hypothetical protein
MRRTVPILAALATALLSMPAQAEISPLVDAYANAVIGRFSSAAQHRADPRYAEVEGAIVRIWPDRADGIWIYQEQAILSGAADRDAARRAPYFQRVSRLHDRGDGTIGRETFTIRDPARFVGLGQPGYAGPAITPADLGEGGCPLIVESAGHGYFTGSSGSCPNSHRGAVSMRSVSVVAGERFVNWDRGFDAEGRLVWGPEAGGYVFDRLAPR